MSFIKKLIVAAAMCCVFASLVAMDVKVVEVTGKVEVQRDNKWVAVSKGDILSAGSVISTGFKSEAVLSFDETVIKVKALTRLTIEQLFEKDGDKASAVYLDTGSISADVKPAENKRVGFAVKTPAATASVRGTSGDVYSDGTVIATSGKWCLTGAEPKLVLTESVPEENDSDTKDEEVASTDTDELDVVEDNTDAGETTTESSTESESFVTEQTGETEQVENIEVPAAESDAVIPAVSEKNTVALWEDYDFSYPNVLGAVYVSAGEIGAVSGGSFVTPFENKIIETSGNSSVQTLSSTEKVVPATPQVVDVGSSSSSTTVEVPKYGTVELTITLPTVTRSGSN